MSKDEQARRGAFGGSDIAKRQTNQLIGIAQGMIADQYLSDDEILFLQKWIAANEVVRSNPLLTALVTRIDETLADGIIDEDERHELLATLQKLTANDFEVGEMIKATTLPLCDPPPEIEIAGARFCFTGTFVFGKRSQCEAAVRDRGGSVGPLTSSTDFLVIGEYATDAWAHETFGRKIEKAVDMREDGFSISIVSEKLWREAL